jgi:hypothetical protein
MTHIYLLKYMVSTLKFENKYSKKIIPRDPAHDSHGF